MKLVKIVAGLLAAGIMAGSQAATVFSEGFDNIDALGAAGWVFTNASTPVGQSWFQGNSGIFAAQSGAADAYVAANFNSSTAVAGLVDNWLISPELSYGAGSTLRFFTRASDAGFLDLLEVRFSSGASSAVSSFTSVIGVIGDAEVAAYPVGSWIAVTMTLPTAVSGRFAFHYSVANALDASYVGIDSVSINTPVPEASTWLMFGLGLAGIGALQRRKFAALESPSN